MDLKTIHMLSIEGREHLLTPYGLHAHLILLPLCMQVAWLLASIKIGPSCLMLVTLEEFTLVKEDVKQTMDALARPKSFFN